MPDLSSAYLRLSRLDEAGAPTGATFLHRLHPAAKLLVCALYVTALSSVGRYDLTRLLLLALYPAAVLILADLPTVRLLGWSALSLPFSAAIGAVGLIFDRAPMTVWGVTFSSGIIGFAVIVLRGYLSLLGVVIFSSTTGIDGLRRGLAFFHLPKLFVELVTFIYRYIFLLLRQTGRLITAWKLRAGAARGVEPEQWGSLGAGLAMRSYDMSQRIHQRMLLRGYDGSLPRSGRQKPCAHDTLYAAVIAVFLILVLFGRHLLPWI